jgi:hypothetical protein
MADKGKKKKARARGRRKRGLVIRSEQTGIIHTVDVRAVGDVANAFSSEAVSRLRTQILTGAAFWSWLRSSAPKLELSKLSETTSAPSFRGVYGGFDPLAVEGSLAAGGRFHVGGAQIQPSSVFPDLQMGACLYLADSQDCARAEASDPGLPDPHLTLAEIVPNRPLTLWKLDAVVEALARPDLIPLLDASPLGAAWKLQKAPLEPQLLGAHLRAIGGDGISYRSARYPGGRGLGVFVKDNDACRALFGVK